MNSDQFQHDFFADENKNEQSGMSKKMGAIGAWMLHIAKVAFLLYSGVHGIMASIGFASDNLIARLAQIAGVVIIEGVLFGLYLAWHNQKITGDYQTIAAGATYGIGFLLATLGIVADSQTNAGVELSTVMILYMRWGLPIAPAIMALGAILTHELAPGQLLAREKSQELQKHQEEEFKAHMASLNAELEAKKTVANMQLNARKNVVTRIAAAYNADEVQEAITQTALANLPQLLMSAGIEPIEQSERVGVEASETRLIDSTKDDEDDEAFNPEQTLHYWVMEEAKKRGVKQTDILLELGQVLLGMQPTQQAESAQPPTVDEQDTPLSVPNPSPNGNGHH